MLILIITLDDKCSSSFKNCYIYCNARSKFDLLNSELRTELRDIYYLYVQNQVLTLPGTFVSQKLIIYIRKSDANKYFSLELRIRLLTLHLFQFLRYNNLHSTIPNCFLRPL